MRYSDKVNVFIGTADSGKAIVGPQVPHGMVKLSPDTAMLPNAGYDYADDKILGFSHCHVEGIGGTGARGYIMLMPTTGEFNNKELEYFSFFDHEHEQAEVGYYSVDLLTYKIKAELAATQNCSIMRYTFPKSDKSRIIVDLSHTLYHHQVVFNGHIEKISNTKFKGYGVYPLTSEQSLPVQCFFCCEISKEADKTILWKDNTISKSLKCANGTKVGGSFEFSTEKNETVYVKTGISFISSEQAENNLNAQIPDWDFDKVVANCKNEWDKALSVIDIETENKDEETVFYSEIYRNLNVPVNYTEANGQYFMGASGERKVFDSKGRKLYSDMWAVWDTFRSTHALGHLLEPQEQADVSFSVLEFYKESGFLPLATCPSIGTETCMIGHHAASVLVESLSKGQTDFDTELAYKAMKNTSMTLDDGSFGVNKEYDEIGFVPFDGDDFEHDFSVSKTLEFAYDDWCTAEISRLMGKTEDWEYFKNRSKNYRNLFDTDLGFVRPKTPDGKFIEPFNPDDSHKRGFCECTPWEYTTLVPHDIQGVINLMGGNERMIAHIDGAFSHNRFNFVNETSFHIPFIYNFAQAPWKTMEVCRKIMPKLHTNQPGGICGEDDSAAMSSWFALTSLGIFCSCPGSEFYSLTSPAFKSWTLKLPENKTFSVKAIDNSDKNIYIAKAQLNGKDYNYSYLKHSDIIAGGELVLYMTDKPTDWATDEDSVPPSLTKERPKFKVISVNAPKKVNAGEASKLTIKLENIGADGSLYVKITENSRLAGEKVCYLNSNNTGEFEIEFTLYNRDTKVISVADKECQVQVVNSIENQLIFDNIKYNKPMIVSGSDDFITVSANAFNKGSFALNTTVPCCLDGKKITKQDITLAPGEIKAISFYIAPETEGNHKVTIGNSREIQIDVAKVVTDEFIKFYGADADFYTAGNNIYINSNGSQHQYYLHRTNKMTCGALWCKEKIKGDFNVEVRIESEEFTSPYAMHGIIVKNTLEDLFNDDGGLMLQGVMSSRGFINNVYNATKDEGSFNFGDAPELPYKVRIERRGNHYDYYYSKKDDNGNWRWQGGATVDSAADEQCVGLYVNSCLPFKRLVKFTDFKIEKIIRK